VEMHSSEAWRMVIRGRMTSKTHSAGMAAISSQTMTSPPCPRSL
jgi:hypothetical protein